MGKGNTMTNPEAALILERIWNDDEWTDRVREALRMALELLQKNEPMKVKVEECTSWGRTYFQPICPKCDKYVVPTEFIGSGEKISYCDSCGQALDWEGVNWQKW